MKVFELTVKKIDREYYEIDSRVVILGNPYRKVISSWHDRTRSASVVQDIVSRLGTEVSSVVEKDSWLHRCRAARPGSLVLSLCWDGASDDSRSADPFRRSVVIDTSTLDWSDDHPAKAEWELSPFRFELDEVERWAGKHQGEQ